MNSQKESPQRHRELRGGTEIAQINTLETQGRYKVGKEVTAKIMILILTPNIDPESAVYRQLMAHLGSLQNIQVRVHREQGVEQSLTEVYLIGNTAAIPLDDMRSLPGVERAV